MSDHHIERPPYETAALGDTLGLSHLRVALQDVSFPRKTSELRDAIGNWRMPITGTHFHELKEFLDGVPEKTLRSAEDVALSVAKAHPELRDW